MALIPYFLQIALKQSIMPVYLPFDDTILLRTVSPGYATVIAMIMARQAIHHLVNVSFVLPFNESYTPKQVPLNKHNPSRKICPPLYTPRSPSLRIVLFNCYHIPIPVLLLTRFDSFCLTYQKGYRVNETILAEVTPIMEFMQKCCWGVKLWRQWNVFWRAYFMVKMSVQLGRRRMMFERFPFQKALSPSSFFILAKQFHMPLYRYFKMSFSTNYGITCILNLTKSSGLATVTEEAMNTHETAEDLILYNNGFYAAGINNGTQLQLQLLIFNSNKKQNDEGDK